MSNEISRRELFVPAAAATLASRLRAVTVEDYEFELVHSRIAPVPS